MTCESFEPRLLEYVENQLSPTEHALVEAHLAGCAACRVFAQQLKQLDAKLAHTLRPPALSPAFNARLQQRIQSIPVLGARERIERKRQLQAEYEAGLARLNPFYLPRRRLLPTLGYVTTVASLGWFLWQFLPTFVNLVARMFQTGLNQNLALAFTVSAIFLAPGLAAAAFPRQLRKILSATAGRGY